MRLDDFEKFHLRLCHVFNKTRADGLIKEKTTLKPRVGNQLYIKLNNNTVSILCFHLFLWDKQISKTS